MKLTARHFIPHNKQTSKNPANGCWQWWTSQQIDSRLWNMSGANSHDEPPSEVLPSHFLPPFLIAQVSCMSGCYCNFCTLHSLRTLKCSLFWRKSRDCVLDQKNIIKRLFCGNSTLRPGDMMHAHLYCNGLDLCRTHVISWNSKVLFMFFPMIPIFIHSFTP